MFGSQGYTPSLPSWIENYLILFQASELFGPDIRDLLMDTQSVIFSERHAQSSSAKLLWCNTQWANLTMQAKKFELPTLPYFDPKTGMLSKDVNHKLWAQIVGQPHPSYQSWRLLPCPVELRHRTKQHLRIHFTRWQLAQRPSFHGDRCTVFCMSSFI